MSADSPEWFQQHVDELDHSWPVGKQLVIPDGGTVVVAGAYRGKVIAYLLQRYPNIGAIHGFEPQSWAMIDAIEHLSPIDKRVALYDYGLLAGIEAKDLPMNRWATDACSLVDSNDRDQGLAHFEPFAKAALAIISSHPEWPMVHKDIDLFIMNVEGYEWELLHDMARIPEGGYIVKPQLAWVKGLCVQFHEHALTSPQQQTSVIAELTAYYGPPVYDSYPEWVYWQKS
jgi:hypothetical protein